MLLEHRYINLPGGHFGIKMADTNLTESRVSRMMNSITVPSSTLLSNFERFYPKLLYYSERTLLIYFTSENNTF